MSKYRLTLVAIGLLAVIILMAGWFVGVQPQLDRISTANAQTASIKQINLVQERKNAALAEDHARIDEYRGQLAHLQTKVPANRSQQALIDQINAAAESTGVTMSNLSFDTPHAYAAPEGVPIGTTASGTLIAVNVTLSAYGDRGQLEQFAGNVQGSQRLITVVDSQYTGPDDAQLTLNGITWVLKPR
ncbi:type 4a pilus biogenesis protein PilO [Microbacterium sp. A82]|uniref:type 4a pilus biogenesis protein PilO n=1 Tax=unclassified Microbacterium TaxID=2609290 RepID=UPI003F35C8B8